MSDPKIEVVNIADIELDQNNPNKGTTRGRRMLRESIKNLGAGRSILLDKENRAIAGNKSLEAARDSGIKRVIVVETTGDEVVAVRRKDLDLATDKKARELSVLDNRTGEIDLAWDNEALAKSGIELDEIFEGDIEDILGEKHKTKQPEKIDNMAPPKMLWILVGVPFNRFDLAQEQLAQLEKISDIYCQATNDFTIEEARKRAAQK